MNRVHATYVVVALALGMFFVSTVGGCTQRVGPSINYKALGGPFFSYVQTFPHDSGRVLHVVEKAGDEYREIDHYVSHDLPCVVIGEKYLVYYAFEDTNRVAGLYVYRNGIQPKLLTPDDIVEVSVFEDRIDYKYMKHSDGTYPRTSIRTEDVIKVAESK